MIWALVVLFVAERTHQWQSLLARDWSFAWKGQRISRRAVIATALVIGWGEGLGFYVQSERAFWAMIFWVYAAHAVLSALLLARTPVRRALALTSSAALVIAMLTARSLDGARPESWLGHPVIDVVPAGELPHRALVPVLAAVLLHAVPCFIANVRRSPPGRRLRSAAVAAGCALAEWWVVAHSVWFPEGSAFPDLVDWWHLGDHAGFLLHPVWMAPFLAHVVVDAIRFGPAERADAA
jgi:hypothetical protein